MSESEKCEALFRDLNEAVGEAVLSPTPSNLADVSTWIKACHVQREAMLKERLEEAAP